MTYVKTLINEKLDNEVRKLIASQVRKQIDAVLHELLLLEEELTIK